jgi:hypothetical protein
MSILELTLIDSAWRLEVVSSDAALSEDKLALYSRLAAECSAMAEQVPDLLTRTLFLEMTAGWRKLADARQHLVAA